MWVRRFQHIAEAMRDTTLNIDVTVVHVPLPILKRSSYGVARKIAHLRDEFCRTDVLEETRAAQTTTKSRGFG